MASEAIELVERLRGALIESGRAAGALLADDVSDDFLMLVPAEVKGTIERLLAEREKLAGWQPIETAPKDGTRVLLYGHRGDQIDIGSWGPHGRYIRAEKTFERAWGEGSAQYNPTHWKPLPEPLSQLGGDA